MKIMENNYILFAGHNYYPEGGSLDFRAFGKTIDELKELFKKNRLEYGKCPGGGSPDPWGVIAEAKTMKTLWWCNRENVWQEYNEDYP